MNSTVSLRQKRSASDILNATFQFIKVRGRILAKTILYFAGPFYLISGIGVGLYWAFIGLSADDSGVMEAYLSNGTTTALIGLVYIAWMISTVAGGLIVTTGVLVIMRLHDERGDTPIEVSEVWQGLKARVGAMLLGYIILGVLAAIGVGVLAAVVGISFAAGGEGLGALTGVLIFIVGVPAFIYVSVSLSVYFALLVVEKGGLLESIQRSFYLVQGYFWTVFGATLLANIVAGVLSSVFAVPNYVIMFIQIATTTEGGGDILQTASVVAGILGTLGGALAGCIPIIAQGLVYFTLVEHKEQVGLSARVDDLEATLGDESMSQPSASPSGA